MPKLTLITGGARSGKSSMAVKMAGTHAGRKAFIATMVDIDAECSLRIERHRAERGPEWIAFETPTGIATLIDSQGHSAIVIDCITLWASNLLYYGLDTEREIAALMLALNSSDTPVYIVTNEVGMGIVPEHELGRRFRDLAGDINKKLAALADEVILMVAGIPVKIK